MAGVDAEHGAADAGVFVDAGGAVGASAVAEFEAVVARRCLTTPAVSLLRTGLGNAQGAQEGSDSAHSAMSR
ncbi:hypothetical protein Manayef4_20850 [Frankia sp. CgMI4]|nr:hypothetical protein Manayef4_20850 [Frankia sp. CgIM4]